MSMEPLDIARESCQTHIRAHAPCWRKSNNPRPLIDAISTVGAIIFAPHRPCPAASCLGRPLNGLGTPRPWAGWPGAPFAPARETAAGVSVSSGGVEGHALGADKLAGKCRSEPIQRVRDGRSEATTTGGAGIKPGPLEPTPRGGPQQ